MDLPILGCLLTLKIIIWCNCKRVYLFTHVATMSSEIEGLLVWLMRDVWPFILKILSSCLLRLQLS